MAAVASSLEQVLARFAREGDLYQKLPQGRVRCHACGHRCLILPGQRGVCKVRWNEDGRLLVPGGYVAGLQLDPVEKKPFFHAFPGARALSFGMLGCDYHCAFCVSGETLIATTEGLPTIEELFERARSLQDADGSIRTLPGLKLYSHTGSARAVRALFRHRYSGSMIRLEPAYLLPLRLTPDHEVLALSDRELAGPMPWPRFIRAGGLTHRHHLAIPRQFEFSSPAVLDVADALQPLIRRIHYRRTIGADFLRRVMRLAARGLTSREIGRRVGKSGSHVRHLRSKVSRGRWDLENLSVIPARVIVEDGAVRLSKEHRPGLPASVPLDEDLAALFGYYAAAGCIARARGRVHAATLVFALGPHESELADTIRALLSKTFGIAPKLVRRPTTLAVEVRKASLALFFEAQCGRGARNKRVPGGLFYAPRPVVEAFLRAYVAGDGHRRPNGMTSIPSVSGRLAREVAWLALKTGRFPSIRKTRQPRRRLIQGRVVRNAPHLYTVYWFDDPARRRWLRFDDRYYYVPLRHVRRYSHDGVVYNLEVDDDHSYLAQLLSTHNCQNWLTSQALRDPAAGTAPEAVTPRAIVDLALHHRARILTSTYNEPLITSEWAVEVFKEGKARGLVASYVSNGNATPEVLDYIRPWVDLYKVDLKGLDDRRYRKLGGVLQTVLDTIGHLHARGFWLEVVTLVIPGFNDSDAELRDIARFLVSVSPDIPWHVTAFHQDYRMTDREATTAAHLIRAAEIGRAAGLRYVYAGNLPGRVGPFENTYCPSCHALLVERIGYRILSDALSARGVCPSCATAIAGRWLSGPDGIDQTPRR